MTCWRARNLIAFYVGGDLKGKRARSLRAHLARCEACAGVLELHRESLAALRSTALRERTGAEHINPWEDIRDKIDKRLLLRGGVADASESSSRHAILLRKAAMIAAFIILPFTAGLVLSPSVARFVFSPKDEDGDEQHEAAPNFAQKGGLSEIDAKRAALSRPTEAPAPTPHFSRDGLPEDSLTRRKILPSSRENVTLVGADRGNAFSERRDLFGNPMWDNAHPGDLLRNILALPPRGGMTLRTTKRPYPSERQRDPLTRATKKRPWIGVTLRDLTDDRTPWRDLYDDLGSRLGAPDGRGAVVMEIVKNSPAHEFGVKLLDVIIGLDGKRMDNREQIGDYVSKKEVGNTITLDILRNKNRCNIKLRLGEKPGRYPGAPLPKGGREER